METFKVYNSNNQLVFSGSAIISKLTDLGLNFVKYQFKGICSITAVVEALVFGAKCRNVTVKEFECEHIARTLIKYFDIDQRNVTIEQTNNQITIIEH